MTHHEIDDSKKENNDQYIPLIDFNDLKSSDTSVAQNDPYTQYRGLQQLTDVLARSGSGNSPNDKLRIPDNVACIGDQCNVLSIEDAAKEKAAILASPNRVNVTDHSKIPDNVECVGNECRVLSPEELAAEKAKHAQYPSVEITHNEKMPDNVVCIGDECRVLSPEEAATERAKMKAAGNNFEVYMPEKGIPDNVKCIGGDCRILTPEEIKAENQAMDNAKRAAQCCVNCCIPEDVKCIGDKCVKLSPEEARAERAKMGLGDTVNISCCCCNGGKCADGNCTPAEAKAAALEASKHVCSCNHCNNPESRSGDGACIAGCNCNKRGGGGGGGGGEGEKPAATDSSRPASTQEQDERNRADERAKADAAKRKAAVPAPKPVDRVAYQSAKEVSWWLKTS